MLPHVVRFNGEQGDNPYVALGLSDEALAMRIEQFLDAAGLPRRLADLGVPEDALPALAHEAARQWTASFNPRPVVAREIQQVYRMAFG
jgi:alcohol dehydrogenase